MKKLFSYILIGFLLVVPAAVHAAAVPAQTTIEANDPALQGQSLTSQQKTVAQALQSVLSRLNDVASQTQLAISEIGATGVDTTLPQTDLMIATADLDNAKIDIAAFSALPVPAKDPSQTLSSLENGAATAESSLTDAKKDIITTLTDLQALIPSISASNSQ